jgi:hypothetical protein
MGEEAKAPREWIAAAQQVSAGTDLLVRIQVSESWGFSGDVNTEAVTPTDYAQHFHISVLVPGEPPISGHGETLEMAVSAARSRVESYIKEQGG